MRLEQLYYFVKTADLHALSAASAELFISQQALSTSIKNLETEFHAQFFIRTPKGMVLTKEGQYFYDTARKILALFEQLHQHFLAEYDLSAASLTVGLNNKVKDTFLPKIISYFYKEYPQFDIQYELMKNTDIVPALSEKKIDLGILPVLEIDKKLYIDLPNHITFVPFHSSNYSLLTSIHSPLASFQTISMSTVVGYPLVLEATSDFQQDLFYQLITQYTDTPDIIWTDSFALQTQMVQDNIGNSLFVRTMPVPFNTLCKIPITNNISIHVGFLIPTDVSATPLRNLFIQKTKNLLANFTV